MDPVLLFVYGATAAVVIMSIVLHEVAHGYVAYLCGDDTAYLMGRLSLNPIRHVDLFRTILLPVICIFLRMPAFGGAKPVPVNPLRFRHPVRDDRLVSLAGVAVNLAIAIVLALALRLGLATERLQPDWAITRVLELSIVSNLALFVFNLTPVPPLDGSHVLRSFLPWEARHVFNMLDQYGLFILLLLIQVPPFAIALWAVIDFLWLHLLHLPMSLMPM